MIIDIRVRGVALDCLLESFECLGRVALLHIYAGDLDPALSQRGLQLHRFFEVNFRTISVPD